MASELKAGRTQNPIELVTDQKRFEALCLELSHERVLGLDVETTIHETPARLCTIQWATGQKNWVVDVFALESLEPLRRLLEDEGIVKVIHYAAFERGVLGEYGFPIENVFDTCVFSRQNRGQGDPLGHSLAAVCEREFAMRLDKTHQKGDWTIRPLRDDQIEYAALDAELMIRLHHKFTAPNEGCTLFG